MNKKGITMWIIYLVIAIGAAAILGWITFTAFWPSEDNAAVDTVDTFIEEIAGEAKKMGGTTLLRSDLWGEGNVMTDNWEADSCNGRPEDIELNVRALIGAAELTKDSDTPVDPEILLALVATETRGSFNHCDRNDLSKVQKSVGGNSWGLGQIEEGTAAELCSDIDIMKMEQNSVCSAKVVQAKIKDVLPGYEQKVANNCEIETHKETFLAYTGPERVAKAYHGLGCGSDADLTYVQVFNNYLSDKPWLNWI